MQELRETVALSRHVPARFIEPGFLQGSPGFLFAASGKRSIDMKSLSLHGLYDAKERQPRGFGWSRLWPRRSASPPREGQGADDPGRPERSASVSALMEGQRWGWHL